MSQCNRCIHCIMAVYCLTGDQFQLDKYQHNHQSNIRSACVCNFLDWNSRSHQAVWSILQQSEYNLAWIDLWWVAVAQHHCFSIWKWEKKRPKSSVFSGEPQNIITNDLSEMQQNNSKWQRVCRFFTGKLHRFFFFFQIRKSSRQYMHRSIFGVYFGGPTFV